MSPQPADKKCKLILESKVGERYDNAGVAKGAVLTDTADPSKREAASSGAPDCTHSHPSGTCGTAHKSCRTAAKSCRWTSKVSG